MSFVMFVFYSLAGIYLSHEGNYTAAASLFAVALVALLMGKAQRKRAAKLDAFEMEIEHSRAIQNTAA